MINTKFKVEKKELYYLLTNLITVKMFFTYPRFLVKNSGNAAWIQCVFVSLVAIGIIFLTIKLFGDTEGFDLLDISEKIGGRGVKIIVGVLLCITFITNTAITMRALPESIKTVLLPLSPMRLLLILSGIAIAIASTLGIYSIARIHALFMPAVFIVFAIMIVLLLGDIRITNIFPILGKGTYNIFIKGLEAVSIFSDIIALYILLPFCKSFNDAKSASKKAVITSGIICSLIVLVYNTVYSYPSSEEFLFPVYQMTRMIKIGDFFQRLEPIFEFFWSISILLYSAFYLFLICYVWKKTFNLKYYKPLVFPVAILLVSAAYIPSSTEELSFASRTTAFLTIPVCLVLPALLALFSSIKQKTQLIKRGK